MDAKVSVLKNSLILVSLKPEGDQSETKKGLFSSSVLETDLFIFVK
jgi:hypothetical protein